MLDLFLIFNRHGDVLFNVDFQAPVPDGAVNSLIREVLMEERVSDQVFHFEKVSLKWVLSNEYGLVFVAGFPKSHPANYATTLLEFVREEFIKEYGREVRNDVMDGVNTGKFETRFQELHRKAEIQDKQSPSASAVSAGAKIEKSKSASNSTTKTRAAGPAQGTQGALQATQGSAAPYQTREPSLAQAQVKPSDNDLDGTASSITTADPQSYASAEAQLTEEQILANRAKLAEKLKKKGTKASTKDEKLIGVHAAIAKHEKPKKGVKSKGGEEPARLDYSDQVDTDGVERTVTEQEVEAVRDKFLRGPANEAYDIIRASDDEDDSEDDEDISDEEDEDEEGDDADNEADTPQYPAKKNESRDTKHVSAKPATSSSSTSGMYSFWKRLTGQNNITKDDLEPVLKQFKIVLMSKNVAMEIAERIVESVGVSLEGKQMQSLKTVKATVRQALQEALTRLLTPKQSTELLADVDAVNATENRPFVIVFCGVNGVGKSTSLAKTCFYLQKHGKKILMAACDTFRSGAVEQLKTHAACLNVDLYHQGYGKDAASVAKEAVRYAKETKADVVLIDTAGRMQHNEPLMRALAKLVTVNQPDRIFFVGEALVGNDAVDQLKSFNASLVDFQNNPKPRLIDGIILTKFDTIDDKVGAAVSMVYTTGQPIVFVGVGQTYMDLRKVSTEALVNALLR